MLVDEDQRLAAIVRSLDAAGIGTLVMGGHAVRYHGLNRNTNDFDLVTSVTSAETLWDTVPRISYLRDAKPIPVWRGKDFVRFDIGTLTTGRPELLEFWIRNHLLDPFDQMNARASVGKYGGETIRFLHVRDLIRSKETERDRDWEDVGFLEEIQDSAALDAVRNGTMPLSEALTCLRSRRGFSEAIFRSLFLDRCAVDVALAGCRQTITAAILLPYSTPSGATPAVVDPDVKSMLAGVEAGSKKHLAVVEIARRAHRRQAMAVDRADKQRQRAADLNE